MRFNIEVLGQEINQLSTILLNKCVFNTKDVNIVDNIGLFLN